jgi:hypothetical protein
MKNGRKASRNLGILMREITRQVIANPASAREWSQNRPGEVSPPSK